MLRQNCFEMKIKEYSAYAYLQLNISRNRQLGRHVVLAFVYVAHGVPLRTQDRRANMPTLAHRCSSKQVAARVASRIFVLLLETRYQTLAHLVTTISDHLLAIR